MSKVILYIASSLDGYIADSNGSVEWLSDFQSQEYGYDAFFSEVGALVMGSNTYAQVLSFGKWPYGDKKTYVFSKRSFEKRGNIEFYYDRPKKLVTSLKRHTKGNIWLVGGSRLIATFLNAGLVDEMRLFVMPILLGHGVPLFRNITKPIRTELIGTERFDNSVIELRHSLSKK